MSPEPTLSPGQAVLRFLPRSTPPRVALGVGGVLFVAALIWMLAGRSHAPATPPVNISVEGDTITLGENAPQWKYVELAVAQEAPGLPPLPAPGRVEFDEKRTASVGTPLQGRVEKVPVRLGDLVKEGDRLFSVRSGAWADLEKELASAREAVEVKRRLATRARELVDLKAAPEKDALAAEAELRESQLALRAAQAKRSSLRISSESDNLFWVVAPRGGTVVDLEVVASQEIQAGGEKPLVRISDLGEVLVVADLQEADAYDLTAGAPVTVHTHAGNVHRSGVLERVSEVVDPKRRTVELRIRASNEDHALRPNSFVDVELQPDPSVKRVRVPAEAVVTEGQRSMVFVARGTGKLERLPVTPGRQREGEVELRSGLEPGTRYVSKGAILLLNQIDLSN
jgi:cobalt-zinc-cadmium efflux system membrane fusion protein